MTDQTGWPGDASPSVPTVDPQQWPGTATAQAVYGGLTITVTVTPTPSAGLAGFSLNGSTNAALKAGIARIQAGTGRGRIVMPGDSTFVGQGGGTADGANGLTNARVNRVAAVFGTGLTNVGIPANDCGITGDNGLKLYNQIGLPAYDPRVSYGNPAFQTSGNQTFAGGALLAGIPNSGNQSMSFAATGVDTFEIVYYNSDNGTLNVAIDGAVPASGPASVNIVSGTGFSTAVVKAANVGNHTLTITDPNQNVAVRSIRGYAAATCGFDILVPAVLGATSANQSSSGSNWQTLDAIKYDAPDLGIANLGLNDMSQGVAAATYGSNIQAIGQAIAITGSPLIVYPHPVDYSFASLAMQQQFNATAKNVAATNGWAFFSLFEYFGSAFTPALAARMFDGKVHGLANLYAEEAQAIRKAVQLMAAA